MRFWRRVPESPDWQLVDDDTQRVVYRVLVQGVSLTHGLGARFAVVSNDGVLGGFHDSLTEAQDAAERSAAGLK